MQTIIHPTAVVEPGARLGAGVKIGPFCHVAGDAVLGDRVELVSHVSVQGATTLGEGCVVHPMAILGGPPQNVKHTGGRTTLVVGANCIIRECVTMHRGSDTSRGETTVGENGNFLANTHIAHDCVIGRNVTMANAAMLGGHCDVGDFVNIGALGGVHQMTRIGHHAFVGGATVLVADLIPFGMALGDRASLRGFNIIGMKRSGMARDEILTLRKAYRMLFDQSRTLSENLDRVDAAFPNTASVREITNFLRSGGKRRFTIPRSKAAADGDDDDES